MTEKSLLELLKRVLDDCGIDRALMMGHSWGGSIVSGFASRFPEHVEGLIIESRCRTKRIIHRNQLQ